MKFLNLLFIIDVLIKISHTSIITKVSLEDRAFLKDGVFVSRDSRSITPIFEELESFFFESLMYFSD